MNLDLILKQVARYLFNGPIVALNVPLGQWHTVKSLDKKTNPLVDYPTLIHPLAWIGDKEFVEIEDFVILNLGCTVGHDSVIKKYSAFMPSVNISGEVTIGEGVYIGTGVKIINQLEIGEYTIVGAGAVVSKTLPAKCTAVGVPAKVIKFHE